MLKNVELNAIIGVYILLTGEEANMLIYLQNLTFNFIAYYIIINSYKLKIGKFKAGLYAFSYVLLGSTGEILALAIRGSELYLQNTTLFFLLIQLCFLAAAILPVVYIHRYFEVEWYRIYWWYGVSFISLSLSNAAINQVLAIDREGIVLFELLNASDLLLYLLASAIYIGLGAILILISKKISVFNTLLYTTKRYQYPIFIFFALVIWISRQSLITRNMAIFQYEIAASILLVAIAFAILTDYSNRNHPYQYQEVEYHKVKCLP